MAGSHSAGRTAPVDALIIGGGHNGLVCAWYLRRGGLSVRVVEARSIVGGAAVTEEFHPGFRNSVASYTVGLLQPRIIADMALKAHGLRIVMRPVANFLPLDDRRHLVMGGGMARTQAAIARFSARDAMAYPAYLAALERVADVLRALALKTPPEAGGGLDSLIRLVMQGWGVARLDRAVQRDLLAIFTRSAREFLDSWFESDELKAALGFDSIVGHYASPDSPGSAYVLLHHVFGEVEGERGAWGHALGGMGAITAAMASACRAAGVEIETDAPVARVLTDGGAARSGGSGGAAAVGVQLADGRELRARHVIANVGPKLLYDRLVAVEDLPPDFARAMRGYAVGSGTFRMNVALSGLPRFSCLPAPGPHLASGIVIAPSLDYMDAAYRDARATGWSAQPVVEMLIPSLLDDSLAPPGAHVASLFCQQFAPRLPGGRDWAAERARAADHVIDTVDRFAPGFRSLVVGRMALSPADLEARFGLAGGDIFHGRMSLDQLWAARPVLGHGSYRGPLRNLWMCGAGTHPGGGVTGAPGHNCAREVLRGW
jgi:phytoene dehydrogenase-like protein